MKNASIDSICGSFLFDGISSSDMERLRASVPLQKQIYPNGATVVRPRSSRGLIFVLRGSVRVVFHKGERAMLVNTITAGGCFGAADLFPTDAADGCHGGKSNSPSQASGEAARHSALITVGETEVLILTEEQLRELFLEFPVISVNYIRFLSDRIRFLNSRISFLSAGSAEKKLAGYLLSNHYPNGDSPPVLNMKETAAALGMGRATFYRALDALQEIGAIHREDGAIKVMDVSLLRGFIDDEL